MKRYLVFLQDDNLEGISEITVSGSILDSFIGDCETIHQIGNIELEGIGRMIPLFQSYGHLTIIDTKERKAFHHPLRDHNDGMNNIPLLLKKKTHWGDLK